MLAITGRTKLLATNEARLQINHIDKTLTINHRPNHKIHHSQHLLIYLFVLSSFFFFSFCSICHGDRNCNNDRHHRLEVNALFRRNQKVFMLQQAMASRVVGKCHVFEQNLLHFYRILRYDSIRTWSARVHITNS